MTDASSERASTAMALLDHDLVFLDCEMTGGDPDRNDIIEIGAVRSRLPDLPLLGELSIKVAPRGTYGVNLNSLRIAALFAQGVEVGDPDRRRAAPPAGVRRGSSSGRLGDPQRPPVRARGGDPRGDRRPGGRRLYRASGLGSGAAALRGAPASSGWRTSSRSSATRSTRPSRTRWSPMRCFACCGVTVPTSSTRYADAGLEQLCRTDRADQPQPRWMPTRGAWSWPAMRSRKRAARRCWPAAANTTATERGDPANTGNRSRIGRHDSPMVFAAHNPWKIATIRPDQHGGKRVKLPRPFLMPGHEPY